MGGQIIGIPESEYDYEFMIVKKLSNGDYQWIENCEDYPYKIENKKDYVIVHDLRISHKAKKNKN